MKKKKPKDKPKEPEQTPRPVEGAPTEKEFGKFVGRLLNVPKLVLNKKSNGTNPPRPS